MVTRRLGLALAVAALVGLLGLAGCTSSGSAATSTSQVYAVGERPEPPALEGRLLVGDGGFNLADHRGDVIVLNFWASWCAPCRVEADDLEGTYQATKASGVTFLGINVHDERDAAVRFADGRFSYPSVFDPASRLALSFDVPPTTIPATFVLDRQGRVAAVIRGAVLRTTFEPLVASLAAEPP